MVVRLLLLCGAVLSVSSVPGQWAYRAPIESYWVTHHEGRMKVPEPWSRQREHPEIGWFLTKRPHELNMCMKIYMHACICHAHTHFLPPFGIQECLFPKRNTPPYCTTRELYKQHGTQMPLRPVSALRYILRPTVSLFSREGFGFGNRQEMMLWLLRVRHPFFVHKCRSRWLLYLKPSWWLWLCVTRIWTWGVIVNARIIIADFFAASVPASLEGYGRLQRRNHLR